MASDVRIVGQSMAMILARFPPFQFAQANAEIKAVSINFGQAQTSVVKYAKQTAFGQAQVKVV